MSGKDNYVIILPGWQDMPRQARKKSETGIYHVVLRGINRQKIFFDNEDRSKFIDVIKKSKEKAQFVIYGYCLMDNHVHLLLRECKELLSLSMQRMCSSFVYWYNWKYDRSGHLLQERFKSEAVENEAYLLTVLRYIHQNPLKAGMTNSVAGYQWSSYHEYMLKPNITDTDFILKIFSTDKQVAKMEFDKFMNQVNDDTCLDYQERHRVSDDELIKLIEEQYGVKKDCFHRLERKEMDMILKNLKDNSGVTIRQLVRVTGVSKFKVEKA